MMMLATTAVLTGAALGLRFKVLILFPVIAFSLAAILIIGTPHSDIGWPIPFAAALTIMALQVGYLTGAVMRFIIAGVRVRRLLPGMMATAQRPSH